MNTTNTLLIIIVVILVGFGVWYFKGKEAQPEPQNGIQVQIGTEEETAY
jgi:uncharacterized membrane protein YqiK